MNNAKHYIDNLQLIKHPEGGWFKENYRSNEIIKRSCLDSRFSGDRSISTSIYFLLEKGEVSAFHKIKSDETWHFHDGFALELFSISPEGELKTQKLGLDIINGELPQITIPQGYYFAAKPLGKYTFVGCTVAPGFDFEDFEMPQKKRLIELFPTLDEFFKTF